MKKSRFANIIRNKGDYIVHNTLFGGVIKAKCDSSRALLDSIDDGSSFEFNDTEGFHRALRDMRIIVDDNTNEEGLANLYYSTMQQKELLIIPFVTRQCNFRCVYCYENFTDERMSEDTYDDLLGVIEQLIDAKGYKSLRISFFGGEPLIEYEMICRFSEKALELAERKGIHFFGGMTTNGYLLDGDKLRKMEKLGIIDYQITVDGLKETHDKSRPLVGGGGSWDKIMENLLDAKKSDCNFRFMIRTNFDNAITSDAVNFLEFMATNFKGDERFAFHFEAAKKLGGKNDCILETVEDEAGDMNDMLVTARKNGLKLSGVTAFTQPFGMVCYAAKNDSFAIDYDGTIMKCTVHLDAPHNRIGSIIDGKLNIKDHLLSTWTSLDLPDKCKACKIYSVCYGKKCPAVISTEEGCHKCTTMYENAMSSLYIE